MTAADPVRLVVVNGCSFTYGTELEDKKHTWGRQVADGLGARFASLAASGGGNRRIARTTVLGLDRTAAAHGCAPHEVLYLVAWTSLDRAEFYDPEVVDKGGRNGEVPDEVYWQRLGHWRVNPTRELAELYYSRLHDPRGAMYNFFLDWALLQSFLRTKGYHQRYVLAQPVLPDLAEVPEVLLSQVDEGVLFGGWPGANAVSFEALTDHLPKGRNKHPLREAHAEFAHRHLLPWLSPAFAAPRD